MSGSELLVSQRLVRAVGISRAASMLESHQEVTLSAINSAIPVAIHIAEFLKHRVLNLHQENKFERVESSSKTKISIHLSLKPLKEDDKAYQAPLPASEVTEKSLSELKKLPWENPDSENPREASRRNWGETDETGAERRPGGYRGRNRGSRGRRGFGRGARRGRGGRDDRETRDDREAREGREVRENNEFTKNDERAESNFRPAETRGGPDDKHVANDDHREGAGFGRSERSRRGGRGRRSDFGRGGARFGRQGRNPRSEGRPDAEATHEPQQESHEGRRFTRPFRRPRGRAPRGQTENSE